MKSPKALIILLACSFLISPSSAQRLPFVVEKPKAPIIWRPYKRPTVPPVQLTNSDRIHALIRAGKLYLTVQDAIDSDGFRHVPDLVWIPGAVDWRARAGAYMDFSERRCG